MITYENRRNAHIQNQIRNKEKKFVMVCHCSRLATDSSIASAKT